MSAQKQAQQLARQLFRLSFENGELSSTRVTGVLQYIEKHCVTHPHAVLIAYHRLVAAEVARSQALIEHAGPISPAAVNTIVGTLARKYDRRIAPLTKRNDALLAGVRVRVGDDLYETSVTGQLAVLAASAT